MAVAGSSRKPSFEGVVSVAAGKLVYPRILQAIPGIVMFGDPNGGFPQHIVHEINRFMAPMTVPPIIRIIDVAQWVANVE